MTLAQAFPPQDWPYLSDHVPVAGVLHGDRPVSVLAPATPQPLKRSGRSVSAFIKTRGPLLLQKARLADVAQDHGCYTLTPPCSEHGSEHEPSPKSAGHGSGAKLGNILNTPDSGIEQPAVHPKSGDDVVRSTTVGLNRSRSDSLVSEEEAGSADSTLAKKAKVDKEMFIGNLVDVTAMIIEMLWPSTDLQKSKAKERVVPLRSFVSATLKRSRTTFTILKAALLYLFKVKNREPSVIAATASTSSLSSTSIVPLDNHFSTANHKMVADIAKCGRRMFLGALIAACKYIQDKNFSNRTWSKIAVLPVSEINLIESTFLRLIDYRLAFSPDMFDRWQTLLLAQIERNDRRNAVMRRSSAAAPPSAQPV